MSAKTFTVCHGNIRIKVKLLPTVKEVHRAYQAAPGGRARPGKVVHAFFREARTGKHVGTCYFPENGRLPELIPHEVSHALIHSHGGVLPKDDEAYCTAVGIICARIFRHFEKMGVMA